VDGVPVKAEEHLLDPSSRAPTVAIRSRPGHPHGRPTLRHLARRAPLHWTGLFPGGPTRPGQVRLARVTTTTGAAVRLSTMPSAGAGRRGSAARCRPPRRPRADEGDGQERVELSEDQRTDVRPSGWDDGVTLGQPTKGRVLRRGASAGRCGTSLARRCQGSKVGVGGTARKVGWEVRGRGFYRARARNPTQP
jgi:hypothetical protein